MSADLQTSWLCDEDPNPSITSPPEPESAPQRSMHSVHAHPTGETRVLRALIALMSLILLFIPLLHDTKKLGYTMLLFIIFCGTLVGIGFFSFGLIGARPFGCIGTRHV